MQTHLCLCTLWNLFLSLRAPPLSAVIPWLCPEALCATCVLVNSLSTSAASTGEIRTVIRLYGASWWTIWASNSKVRGTRCSEKPAADKNGQLSSHLDCRSVNSRSRLLFSSWRKNTKNSLKPKRMQSRRSLEVGGGSSCQSAHTFFQKTRVWIPWINIFAIPYKKRSAVGFTVSTGIYLRQNI